LIGERMIESAHDCSDGGLAVALAESAFPKGVGAEGDLSSNGLFFEGVMFCEAASRVVISCDPQKTENIKQITVSWCVRADRIGRTVPEKLVIQIDGRQAVAANVSELRQIWDTALTKALHADAPEHPAPEVLQKS